LYALRHENLMQTPSSHTRNPPIFLYFAWSNEKLSSNKLLTPQSISSTHSPISSITQPPTQSYPKRSCPATRRMNSIFVPNSTVYHKTAPCIDRNEDVIFDDSNSKGDVMAGNTKAGNTADPGQKQ